MVMTTFGVGVTQEEGAVLCGKLDQMALKQVHAQSPWLKMIDFQ